jgi:hypothetical protein
MVFNKSHFWKFCENLRIQSKDKGLIPLVPNGGQVRLIDEIAKGLNEDDIHYFVILKGRQGGISTICIALDLYWNFKHHPLQGTLVVHEESARDFFRTIITNYMHFLPDRYKVPVKFHNRTQMVLKNKSQLLYQIAGTRSKSNLGRGTAVSFAHLTEVAFYGDEEGLKSLEKTFSDVNPNRLYLFESTANGFNHFHDMWETSKRAVTQKAIFIGWWLNEANRAERGTDIFEAYWDGEVSADEQVWVNNVYRLYKYEIQPEQIAWWRWHLEEKNHGDLIFMMQEYPPTEDDAFVLSGSQFFTSEKITKAYRHAMNYEDNYHSYKFKFGEQFDETELKPTTPLNAELKIWKMPRKGGYYVIGADPAYGSSDWADRFAIQVLRCYSDGIEQVAEYATDTCNTFQFAWIIAYLAGAYGNCMVNLEINGPGQAVWNEILNMKRQAGMGAAGGLSPGVNNVLGSMRNYLYRRNDSIGVGGLAYHFKTTYDTKARMMHNMKDWFERENFMVRSTDALDEMKSIVVDGGSIEASGKGKDDRVISLALASIAWAEWIRFDLMQMGMSHAAAKRKDELDDTDQTQVGNMVMGYLKRIGIKDVNNANRS